MLNPNDPLTFKVRQEVSKSDEGKAIVRKDPTLRPKRDFEKVMKKKDKDQDDSEVGEVNSKKNLKKALKDVGDESESPNTLFAKMAKEKATRERTEYLTEQNDIAAISPNSLLHSSTENPIAIIVTQDLSTERAQMADRIKQIQEIIDQIVDKVYTLKQEGRMDTILTLRHPPLFAGAELKLTEYNTARGEFNLTFSNLSNQAKAVLDASIAHKGLQQALEQKGYVAHIVVVTTEKDKEVVARPDQTLTERSNRDNEERDESQQQKKRNR